MRGSAGRCLYMGVDFGTSGARASVIDGEGNLVASSRCTYDDVATVGWAAAWERALIGLLQDLPADVKHDVKRLAFDGTSGTVLLVDRRSGEVLRDAKLYSEKQPPASVSAAKEVAPMGHTSTAANSPLCKMMTWHLEGVWQAFEREGKEPCLLHQADWLLSLLTGIRDTTDWNNCLKLGFDPESLELPTWLTSQPWSHMLPRVILPPGRSVACVSADVAKRTGLSPQCVVVAGTTDSIAAFLAAGVSKVGEAVTSLGSTMAIKMLSENPVNDASYGIYSHRLEMGWLVGGASNTGGLVLRQLFSDEQLRDLTAQMDVSKPTRLDYYPLAAPGETFPVYDPSLPPRLEPRPPSDVVFLQGIFESMARIEARAYGLLAELGASPVQLVYTAGGGAANPVWTELRSKAIGVPVLPSPYGEASYGAAMLALSGAKEYEQTS